MYRNKTPNRKKIMVIFTAVLFVVVFLVGRLVYLMIFCSEYYGRKAEDLHERERDIKAARGKIYDANGVLLASNRTVCTVSVIHSQIEEPEKVIQALVKELGMPEKKKKNNKQPDPPTTPPARKQMNTLSAIIHIMNWRLKCLDLPEGIIRELSDWR